MVKFQKSIRDISIISVIDFLGAGISGIFWFYLASELGPEGYGQVSYIIAIAQTASVISLFGASHTLVVYTAKNVKIQSTISIVSLTIGIISTIILFMIFQNMELSFLSMGYVIFALVISEIIGRKSFIEYAKFILIQRALMVILGILFYYYFDLNGIILGMALSFLPYIYQIRKIFQKNILNFSLFKEKISFILNSYFERIATVLNNTLDKIIIGYIFGDTILGNYSLGLQFFLLLLIVPQVAWKYFLPNDSIGVENKQLKKILILISIGLTIICFIIVPILIDIIFPQFATSIDMIKIISIGIIPASIYYIYHSKFLGLEKSRYIFISSLILVITQISGIIFLGELFKSSGIAISIVLAYTIAVLYMLVQEKINHES